MKPPSKEISRSSNSKSYTAAWNELKKREVWTVGLIESLFLATNQIFLFIWTPILQGTWGKQINVGFIFLCFVINMILGTALFQLVIIDKKFSYYGGWVLGLTACLINFIVIYLVDMFLIRFIFLSFINGLIGYFYPLNSIIKSKVLKEQNRTFLMNIFRVPLNVFVIMVLLFLKHMEPFTVIF